jgi:hypothetical protein
LILIRVPQKIGISAVNVVKPKRPPQRHGKVGALPGSITINSAVKPEIITIHAGAVMLKYI